MGCAVRWAEVRLGVREGEGMGEVGGRKGEDGRERV